MLDLLGIAVFWVLPAVAAIWCGRVFALEHRRDRIPILLYHRLLDRQAAARGEVRDDEFIFASYDDAFADQMAYLASSGYVTLDLDEYTAIRSGEAALPERPVVITLDDGYDSSYRYAYPALREHGLRATIFVVLEPDEYTREQVAGIDGFLGPEQIREMAENGISIQSHTVRHRVLTELDDESVRWELEASRTRLAEISGRPVDHIAIPRAGYDRRVRRLVAEAGYKTACCNRKGSTHGGSDPLALPRIVIERDMSLTAFARALQPGPAAVLRIIGELKRLPERLGGARLARVLRPLLYGGPLRGLFRTRNLKRVLVAAGLLYLGAILWFSSSFLGRLG